jgi:hypothetical protein
MHSHDCNDKSERWDSTRSTTLLLAFSVNHTNFNKNAISFYS